MRLKAAATLVFIIFALGPKVPPQCEQIVFARANPGLCTVTGGPFGSFGGGGGGDGGLLGSIGRVVHSVTGGLL